MYLLRWVDDAPEFLPKLVLLRGGLLVSRAAFLPASVFMAARRFSWPARILGAYSVKTELRARYVAYRTAAAASLSLRGILTPHDL